MEEMNVPARKTAPNGIATLPKMGAGALSNNVGALYLS